MIDLIAARQTEIADLCRRHSVVRLDVFGSATGDGFDPAASDLDFLVEFESLSPVAYKRAYFGLLWELEALFQRPIDLVTSQSLRNPHFIESVYQSRERIYGG